MRTPSFTYMGGKVRLRKWLIEKFPQSGRYYIEPFVGRANVFFQAKKDLDYSIWVLNDLDISFFRSLITVDLTDLPKTMDKDSFLHWKNSGCDIAKLIEPRITFTGKGYKYGYSGHIKGHVGYSYDCYKKNCENARELLSDAIIFEQEWLHLLEDLELTEADFIYLDPPYYGAKATYPNIDHNFLVKKLNGLKCRWALSGYENEIYAENLNFINRYEKQRNAEIKGLNTQKKETVIEVLWTNY